VTAGTSKIVEPADALQQLDLVVGRVTAAESHRGARGPSALLKLDLGGRGPAEAPLPVRIDEAQALVGAQVVCAVGAADVVVLAVRAHDGVVVVCPARDVSDGSPVA
jgi:tRNA-binding EMAP/Myf-like protein